MRAILILTALLILLSGCGGDSPESAYDRFIAANNDNNGDGLIDAIWFARWDNLAAEIVAKQREPLRPFAPALLLPVAIVEDEVIDRQETGEDEVSLTMRQVLEDEYGNRHSSRQVFTLVLRDDSWYVLLPEEAIDLLLFNDIAE
ncbi:hypothetical protein K8R78_08085 [bacterium]|nr:hypothetical protein [bacterium]